MQLFKYQYACRVHNAYVLKGFVSGSVSGFRFVDSQFYFDFLGE